MRPIYILAPYWMGEFSPARLAAARHNWRVLTPPGPPPPEAGPTERMGLLCQALAAEVAAIRAEGHLPVIIAGDCTFSLGVLAGLQPETPDLTLVWYDAHGDFNTHQTSPSGFIGGMPLAMLCGRGEQTIRTAAGAEILPEDRVILTDARDLDPAEAAAMAASDVTHLPQVSQIAALDLPDQPLYLHFDSDVLPLSAFSAVSYPAPGGPTLEAVETSLAHLAQTGRIAALSVTMWNPDLDDEQKSAEQTLLGLIQRLVDRV